MLYIVVGKGGYEAKSTLKPYRLGGVVHRAVAIEASVDAAVLAVPSVFYPEGHDVVHKFVAIGIAPVFDILLYVVHNE